MVVAKKNSNTSRNTTGPRYTQQPTNWEKGADYGKSYQPASRSNTSTIQIQQKDHHRHSGRRAPCDRTFIAESTFERPPANQTIHKLREYPPHRVRNLPGRPRLDDPSHSTGNTPTRQSTKDDETALRGTSPTGRGRPRKSRASCRRAGTLIPRTTAPALWEVDTAPPEDSAEQ